MSYFSSSWLCHVWWSYTTNSRERDLNLVTIVAFLEQKLYSGFSWFPPTDKITWKPNIYTFRSLALSSFCRKAEKLKSSIPCQWLFKQQKWNSEPDLLFEVRLRCSHKFLFVDLKDCNKTEEKFNFRFACSLFRKRFSPQRAFRGNKENVIRRKHLGRVSLAT